MPLRRIPFFFLVLLASTPPALAGEWTFFPLTPTFRPLIADPREPVVGLGPYLDRRGFESSLGGTLELVRFTPAKDLQFGFGAFGGVFLLTETPDLSRMIGDAWVAGLNLEGRHGAFSWRLQFEDEKANLGDAFYDSPFPFYPYDPEVPLASRFFFTRDNYSLTLSLDAFDGLRLFAGGGTKVFWDDFNPSEGQAFAVAGFEAFLPAFDLLDIPCRPYGTWHFKYQDQAGGTRNHTLQAGLAFAGEGGRRLRLALTYFNGKSEFWHFFQHRDEHAGVQVFFDP